VFFPIEPTSSVSVDIRMTSWLTKGLISSRNVFWISS
jgi:hypothetical protein